jgi:hypothetical protein
LDGFRKMDEAMNGIEVELAIEDANIARVVAN